MTPEMIANAREMGEAVKDLCAAVEAAAGNSDVSYKAVVQLAQTTDRMIGDLEGTIATLQHEGGHQDYIDLLQSMLTTVHAADELAGETVMRRADEMNHRGAPR